jgi:anti-anti-sigma factor
MSEGSRFEVLETPGDPYVVSVRGELDVAVVGQLETALSHADGGRATALMIDLVDCSFIDSSGVWAILRAARPRMENGDGGRLAIACYDGEVSRTLSIAGIDQVVPVLEGRDEALRALSMH